MPARSKMPRPRPTKPSSPSAYPDVNPPVIVDIVFDEGVFFITVENISDQPVRRVSIQWEPKFTGLGGTQQTSSLLLFKNIEFLAPRKVITTLLDSSSAYFQRGEPTRLTAKISYLAADEKTYTVMIVHDLAIYKDLTYTKKPNL